MREISVPLRGYGFEMTDSNGLKVNPPKFPSPCGDMVLKWILGITPEVLISTVSVPLRGYGFEIIGVEVVLAIVSSFRPLAGIWF